MAPTDTNNRTAIPSVSTDDHITVYDGRGGEINGVFMSWLQPQRGHDAFTIKANGEVKTVSLSPTVTVDLAYKPIDVQHHPDMEVVRHETLHPSQRGLFNGTVEFNPRDAADFTDAFRTTQLT